MRHLPYPKIALAAQDTTGGRWIATEKIHGAQLTLATDGSLTRVGKRKAWLAGDEPFFGWQLLRDRLTATALAAHHACGGTVRLYGELYGGAYPSPSVAAVPGVSAVQTGVWYCPGVRFALFDVLVGDPAEYLPYDEIAAIAAAGGVDAVPLLARGTRAEMGATPTRFPTTVPGALGLPALPGNLAEGVVVRADARLPAGRRPILKRKIPEFDERRFDASRPFDPRAALTAGELAAVALGMVNPARVASARSKVGALATAIAEEVALDVLVDLADAFPAAMARLDDAAEAALAARLRAAALA
ncbi:hypothetical protein Afil01_49640 [Actinorhabdospora filicis]|uniref:RNA ligase domain-containing protein n=1 Tax=Actinorhabdospora filicis TaxID=1785913 RepID=A0A9W6SQ89_9ACTN|nr:RNA ligase family protein [Actinorhabdospora filicis]GLZ80157.1 hypothetical protein Afil01_49640 [Actinorhabdospora filicis]